MLKNQSHIQLAFIYMYPRGNKYRNYFDNIHFCGDSFIQSSAADGFFFIQATSYLESVNNLNILNTWESEGWDCEWVKYLHLCTHI